MSFQEVKLESFVSSNLKQCRTGYPIKKGAGHVHQQALGRQVGRTGSLVQRACASDQLSKALGMAISFRTV